MATPIRLLAGPQNDIQMNLLAQSIDISVDRRVSHFPTPDNILKRFAIDTNTPTVNIEVSGVIIDDEGIETSTASTGSTPMRTLINFGSFLPTEPFSSFTPSSTSRARRFGSFAAVYKRTASFPHLTATQRTTKGTTSLLTELVRSGVPTTKQWPGTVSLDTDIQPNLIFPNAHSIGATGALTVETTLSQIDSRIDISYSPEKVGAAALLNVGDRVVLSDGTLLGIVSALTDTSVTFEDALTVAISANDELFVTPKVFNSRNELVGYVTALYEDSSPAVGDPARWLMQLSGVTEATILEGEKLTINQSNDGLESILHEASAKLVPSYWLESPSRNPKGSLCNSDADRLIDKLAHIGIVFRFNANRTPSLLGGSDPIALAYRAASQPRNQTYSVRAGHQGDAFHHDAIIQIPIKGIASTAGKNPALIMAQLFEEALELAGNVSNINISPDGKTLADAFKVTRVQSVVIIEQTYKPDKSITHPPIFSQSINTAFFPEVFQGESSPNQTAKKSAGDKVQDLVGLVSNAHKDIDLFRGIQIPYDSLVTSSSVTGIARNFFLTFGSIPASQKGSLSNTRSASELMNRMLLTGDQGGNIEEDTKEGFFEKLADSLVPDTIQSLVGFLTNLVEDTFVTLATPAHGNDGGIRIMPENLHVRYDAGNNYYAFTLLLVATDFVLGV